MRTRVAASGAVVFLLVLVCAAAAFSPNTRAARDRGSITGTVADAAGAALPGVTVTLRGADQRKTVTARARTYRGDDSEGYRAEFIKLVDLASSLRKSETTASRR
jgi:hypothetical protein